MVLRSKFSPDGDPNAGRRLHGSLRLASSQGTDAATERPGDAVAPDHDPRYDPRPDLAALPGECALAVEVNGRPATTLRCTRDGATELAVGWALGQGLVARRDDLRRVTADGDRVSLMVLREAPAIPADRTPDDLPAWDEADDANDDLGDVARLPLASAPAPPPDPRWPRARVLAAVERGLDRLAQPAPVVVQAALMDPSTGARICLARDLSAANAAAKAIGWAYLDGRLVPAAAATLALLVTGQPDRRIVRLAGCAGVRLVAAPVPPTAAAVECAGGADDGPTLLGRTPDGRWAAYAHAHRLADPDAIAAGTAAPGDVPEGAP